MASVPLDDCARIAGALNPDTPTAAYIYDVLADFSGAGADKPDKVIGAWPPTAQSPIALAK
jgi:hypothetical protein